MFKSPEIAFWRASKVFCFWGESETSVDSA